MRTSLSVLYDLHVVDNHAGDLLEAAMNVEGSIHPIHFAVYSLLLAGPITPGRISEEMSTSPSTITGVIRRMEELGHARRAANPDDARSFLIELTQEGVDAHAKAAMRFGDVSVPLANELGEDREWVRWALRRLDHAMLRISGVEAGELPPRPAEPDLVEGLTARQREAVMDFVEFQRWQGRRSSDSAQSANPPS